MTSKQSQFIYGLLVAISGTMIIQMSFQPTETTRYIIGTLMAISGIFAFIVGNLSVYSEVRQKYNELQGIWMVAYSLAIFFSAITIARFVALTMGLMLFLGITEIFFTSEFFAYKRKFNLWIIVARMISGFLMTIGSLIMFAFTFDDMHTSLLGAGILIAFTGFNFMLFAKSRRTHTWHSKTHVSRHVANSR